MLQISSTDIILHKDHRKTHPRSYQAYSPALSGPITVCLPVPSGIWGRHNLPAQPGLHLSREASQHCEDHVFFSLRCFSVHLIPFGLIFWVKTWQQSRLIPCVLDCWLPDWQTTACPAATRYQTEWSVTSGLHRGLSSLVSTSHSTPQTLTIALRPAIFWNFMMVGYIIRGDKDEYRTTVNGFVE